MTAQQSRYRTGNQALVREINLSMIMNVLRETAPVSRSSLAQMTGLNKTTVSSLVQELIDQRFVHEVGFDVTSAGRPAMLLDLNPAGGVIISCELGVDFISVIATNFAANVVWRHRAEIPQTHTQQVAIAHLLELLEKAIAISCDAYGRLLGMAVGVPGLVDQGSGTLFFAPNLDWKDIPLGQILRTTFNVPVFIDNEANLAALGEHYFGAIQNHNEVLYVSVGIGLGGGIIRDGQLFNGATGFAGEFGHIVLDPNGKQCKCGNRGCWETFVNPAALFDYLHQALDQGPESLLTQHLAQPEHLTIAQVAQAAQAGDAVARSALGKIGYYLGLGIASLVNALNPDLVVLGGPLGQAGEQLLPEINRVLANRVLHWRRQATPVILAQHGSDACVMGGLAMVYQAILANPSNGLSDLVSTSLPVANHH